MSHGFRLRSVRFRIKVRVVYCRLIRVGVRAKNVGFWVYSIGFKLKG